LEKKEKLLTFVRGFSFFPKRMGSFHPSFKFSAPLRSAQNKRPQDVLRPTIR